MLDRLSKRYLVGGREEWHAADLAKIQRGRSRHGRLSNVNPDFRLCLEFVFFFLFVGDPARLDHFFDGADIGVPIGLHRTRRFSTNRAAGKYFPRLTPSGAAV